jgi:hypothetical protein
MEVRRKDGWKEEGTRALKRNDVLPAGYCPEGVAVERFSPELMQLVETALPEQGRALISHLLSYATCAPRQAPSAWWARFTEQEKEGYSAWIVVRSLNVLARSEDAPCRPDRYYQLVLVLDALQVLKRQVHRSREAPHEYITILHLDLSARPCPLSTLLRSCSQLVGHCVRQ